MPYFGNQECYSILTTYVAFDVKQFKASFSMKMGVFYIRIFPYILIPLTFPPCIGAFTVNTIPLVFHCATYAFTIKVFGKHYRLKYKNKLFIYYFSKSLNEMKIYTNVGYFSFSPNQSNKDY